MKFRLSHIAAAALGVCAGVAYADPITIATILGSMLVTAGYTIAGYALVIGAAVYGNVKARRAARAAQASVKAAYNASLADRTLTIMTENPAWRIIYGRAIVGCDIIAQFTTDKTGLREDGTTYTRPDALKHLVLHIASHEVQAIHQIFIAGIPIGPLDGSGIPTTTGTEWRRDYQKSYYATLDGAGNATISPSAVGIISAGLGVNFVLGVPLYEQDVTSSIVIGGGGTTLTGPPGAVVQYAANFTQANVRFQIHLGDPAQTVDTYLNGLEPTRWDSSHRLRNRAYVIATIDLENPRFQGGPPSFTFDVSGRKIFNPVTGLTVWTDNAALCIRDYLINKWGFNTSSTLGIDTTTWNQAIADCDSRLDGTVQSYTSTFTANASTDEITFPASRIFNTGDGVRFVTTGTLPGGLSLATTYYIIRQSFNSNTVYKLASSLANAYAGTVLDITTAGTGTHTCSLRDYPAYTINGLVFSSENQERVLEEFSRAMGGTVTNIGRWFASAGIWHTSVMDITDDDLDGAIGLPSCDTELDNLINGQRGQFVPAGFAVGVEYDVYQNSTFRTADGEDLFDDFTYRFTNTRYRVRNLSRIRVEENRNGQQILIPGKLKLLPLQPGDRIRVTNSELAVTNKYYRVTDTQFGYQSTVMITAIEDDSTIWDLADAASVDPTPNSGLPNPHIVSQVTLTPAPLSDNTTGSYGGNGQWIPRVKVSWAAITDPYMSDQNAKVWVGWNTSSNLIYQWQSVPPDQRFVFLSGFAEQTIVHIQVYAQNSFGDKGPPSYAVLTVPFTQNAPGWTNVGAAKITNDGVVFKDQQFPGVSAAWNASVYTNKYSVNGARIKGVVATQAGRFMIGLSQTVGLTVNTYLEIDFALYQDKDSTGFYSVYELGMPKFMSTVVPQVNDSVEVLYTGGAVIYSVNNQRIYQHGAPSNLPLFGNCALYTPGVRILAVEYAAFAVATRGNLINSDVWPNNGGVNVINTNVGTFGGSRFELNQDNPNENAIALFTAPDGILRPCWRCSSIATVPPGPDGGWNMLGDIPIDPTKMYRVSLWVLVSSAGTLSGSAYLGVYPNSVADIATGTPNGNPYVTSIARTALVPDRWYLMVGFILPSNFGTTVPSPKLGGWFDGVTGELVQAADADYKWASGATSTSIRAYQYYTTTNGGLQYFWGPRLEMCDGSEPSIKELLAPALDSKSITYDNAFDAAFGLNGSFNRWPVNSTYPTGWSLWSNAGGITKETVTFADGPNAIRFTTGGTDTGIVWQVTFGTGAIPAVGSFVEVTIAGQVLSNIGGGFPGALIRLYTDAALSGGGIRDTTLLFNKTTSGWQTQTVNAAPRAGEGIYGVVIYLIGAWSGMPGGQWNGTIIMDKVEVKVKSPAVVGTIAPGAATSNVSSDVTSSGIAIPNSSSTWDPYGASPGTSVAGPGPSFTHTVGYNYIINSNLNLRWFLNNVTTLFTITVSARLALRDLTAGGNNILIGAGVTMYENWMYDNATGTGNRISNHNHSFTTTVLGSSLIVGHVYQVGVWIGAIRFTDTTGAQVAPGASSFLNIDQDDTVITLKA